MTTEPVGVFWITGKDDYEQLVCVLEDGSQLPDSYAAWLRGAKKGLEGLRQRNPGTRYVTVDIDLQEFTAWCIAENRDINAASGRAFANWKVRLGVHQDGV